MKSRKQYSSSSKKLKMIQPKMLGKNREILVVFTIPEVYRSKRDSFRYFLKKLLFLKVQNGVWKTEYDYKEYLKSTIAKHNLQKYVSLYESSKIDIIDKN